MNETHARSRGTTSRSPRSGRQAAGSGTWVRGLLNGHRFDALVFPEHAENPEYELRASRISKLWIKRLADQQTVFNWDRGMDIPATDETAEARGRVPGRGVADFIFGAATR